jgi:hypothetical protein
VSDERKAYTPGDAVYIKTGKRPVLARNTSTRTEERIGSLLAGGGMIWSAYAVATNYPALLQLRMLPPGPLEVSAIGILVWLHAKWRRSLQPK